MKDILSKWKITSLLSSAGAAYQAFKKNPGTDPLATGSALIRTTGNGDQLDGVEDAQLLILQPKPNRI